MIFNLFGKCSKWRLLPNMFITYIWACRCWYWSLITNENRSSLIKLIFLSDSIHIPSSSMFKRSRWHRVFAVEIQCRCECTNLTGIVIGEIWMHMDMLVVIFPKLDISKAASPDIHALVQFSFAMSLIDIFRFILYNNIHVFLKTIMYSSNSKEIVIILMYIVNKFEY